MVLGYHKYLKGGLAVVVLYLFICPSEQENSRTAILKDNRDILYMYMTRTNTHADPVGAIFNFLIGLSIRDAYIQVSTVP